MNLQQVPQLQLRPTPNLAAQLQQVRDLVLYALLGSQVVQAPSWVQVLVRKDGHCPVLGVLTAVFYI